MTDRFRRMLPSALPVIAMAHVPALPGSPLYDAQAGIEGAIDDIRRDLEILVEEGVDAVLFCNENDRPYLLEAPPVHVAALAHRRRARPRGVPVRSRLPVGRARRSGHRSGDRGGIHA